MPSLTTTRKQCQLNGEARGDSGVRGVTRSVIGRSALAGLQRDQGAEALMVLAARRDRSARPVIARVHISLPAGCYGTPEYDGVVPIPGTRRVKRLEENAGDARLELAHEDLADLDALPAPGGQRFPV